MNVMAQDTLSSHSKLHSATDSLDYFFGVNLGYSLEKNPYIYNKDLVLEGFMHAIRGTAEQDINLSNNILRGLINDMAKGAASPQSAESMENLSKGRAFLLENGKKEGVLSTESGLQYEIIRQGSGPNPTASSTVEVHYEGTLIDGTQFDSSYKRGESISFPLNRVIRGWTEGVQLMQVGSVYKFYIPSELAYGSQSKASIPPNSVLIFEIELLDIK
jgi:FKBP-type peptidyl-prolyl cis-trans isomerase FkpA